ILGYEKGDAMARFRAPARRVGLGFLDASAPLNLTREGWALFEAAVDWASSQEKPAGEGSDQSATLNGPSPRLTATSPGPRPPQFNGVLMLVGSTTLSLGDAAIKAHLENGGNGFAVTVKTSFDPSDLTDTTVLVVITATAPVTLGTQLRDVGVGVVTAKTTLF